MNRPATMPMMHPTSSADRTYLRDDDHSRDVLRVVFVARPPPVPVLRMPPARARQIRRTLEDGSKPWDLAERVELENDCRARSYARQHAVDLCVRALTLTNGVQ